MPIWINAQEIEALLTMDEAITAVEEGFRQLALGDVAMPQRVGIAVAEKGGWGAAMPAYVGGGIDGLGLKLVTIYPNNPARHGLPAILATLLLLDPHSGQLLAVMDAAALTAVRTGAASGVATRYLARQDAQTALIFGPGVQGRDQLAAVCAVRPIQQAWVVGRRPESAAAFAREMSQRLGLAVEATQDVQAAVQAADVIVAATSANDPLFDGRWLRPGVHINGVGSHTPTAREVDTVTVQRAKVVTDQTSACLAEAGDLIIPIQAGAFTEAQIHAQLGEIVAGLRPGRTDDGQITFFKSVGLAIQDVAVAAAIYRKAVATGKGQGLQ